MAEGGCTTCCALLSAAFVLIGCAEPLAISTSESMIVHNFQTPSRPQPRSPSEGSRVSCLEVRDYKNKIDAQNLLSPLFHNVQRMRRLARTKGVTDLTPRASRSALVGAIPHLLTGTCWKAADALLFNST